MLIHEAFEKQILKEKTISIEKSGILPFSL